MMTAVTLHLLRATHPTVPGQPTSIHFDRKAADAAAQSFVTLLVADFVSIGEDARLDYDEAVLYYGLPTNWRKELRLLQVARAAYSMNYPIDDVEDIASSEGDEGAWLAEQSGCDVWIEEIEATLPEGYAIERTERLTAPAVEQPAFPHSPDHCPSKHWNNGNDICADCGKFLG